MATSRLLTAPWSITSNLLNYQKVHLIKHVQIASAPAGASRLLSSCAAHQPNKIITRTSCIGQARCMVMRSGDQAVGLEEAGHTQHVGSKFTKRMLYDAGKRLYICNLELSKYELFQKELDIPDTFTSWFNVTGLKIWLTYLRLVQDGDQGVDVVDSMFQFFTKDAENRIKMLSKTNRSKNLKIVWEGLNYGFRAYSEGLKGNDIDLAEAVWDVFYQKKQEDPEKVEAIVHYIRKQISYSVEQDSHQVLGMGIMNFLPIVGDVDSEHAKKVHIEALKLVPMVGTLKPKDALS